MKTILTAALILIVLSTNMARASNEFSIRFRDLPTNELTDRYIFNQDHELAVVSESADLRVSLPLIIEIYVNGEGVAQTQIPNNPDEFCTGPNYCGVQGFVMSDPGSDASIEIFAFDRENFELVHYVRPGQKFEGELSQRPDENLQLIASEHSSPSLIIWLIRVAAVIAIMGSLIVYPLRRYRKTKKRDALT